MSKNCITIKNASSIVIIKIEIEENEAIIKVNETIIKVSGTPSRSKIQQIDALASPRGYSSPGCNNPNQSGASYSRG